MSQNIDKSRKLIVLVQSKAAASTVQGVDELRCGSCAAANAGMYSRISFRY